MGLNWLIIKGVSEIWSLVQNTMDFDWGDKHKALLLF